MLGVFNESEFISTADQRVKIWSGLQTFRQYKSLIFAGYERQYWAMHRRVCCYRSGSVLNYIYIGKNLDNVRSRNKLIIEKLNSQFKTEKIIETNISLHK